MEKIIATRLYGFMEHHKIRSKRDSEGIDAQAQLRITHNECFQQKREHIGGDDKKSTIQYREIGKLSCRLRSLEDEVYQHDWITLFNLYIENIYEAVNGRKVTIWRSKYAIQGMVKEMEKNSAHIVTWVKKSGECNSIS